MYELLNQIKLALDNKLYYLALQSSLTIPDICASLQSTDGKTNRMKYIEWYDTHILEKSFIDGETCYRLRCSSLHQGHTQNEKSKYSRILFIEPNSNYIMHNNIINDALNIDILIFCNSILDAAKKWLSSVQSDETFKSNYSKFMKRYEFGLPPYIIGVPVIS